MYKVENDYFVNSDTSEKRVCLFGKLKDVTIQNKEVSVLLNSGTDTFINVGSITSKSTLEFLINLSSSDYLVKDLEFSIAGFVVVSKKMNTVYKIEISYTNNEKVSVANVWFSQNKTVWNSRNISTNVTKLVEEISTKIKESEASDNEMFDFFMNQEDVKPQPSPIEKEPEDFRKVLRGFSIPEPEKDLKVFNSEDCLPTLGMPKDLYDAISEVSDLILKYQVGDSYTVIITSEGYELKSSTQGKFYRQ